jgi:hypothetical protein
MRGLGEVILVPDIAVPAPVPAMIKAMELKNIILITLLAITSTLPTLKYIRDYLRAKSVAGIVLIQRPPRLQS